jgi:hypothetical protein
MESPPPSERAAIIGRDGDRESARDGFRVDDERQHQGVYKGGYRR